MTKRNAGHADEAKRLGLTTYKVGQTFPLDMKGQPFKPPGAMQTAYPDLRHYTLRDYGNRVGIFRIMQALDAIDAEAPSYSLSRPAALRRVFAVLAAVCVSLLILHYSRYSTNFHALLGYLGQWRMQDAHYYLRALEASGWLELAGYAWWTGCHLLTFILIPWLVIRWLFKEKMIDFGWRWNQVGAHWRGYLLLLSPILVFVVLVSFGEDFVNHYPFYGLAGRSWLDFLLWELLYMSQFIFLGDRRRVRVIGLARFGWGRVTTAPNHKHQRQDKSVFQRPASGFNSPS